MVKNHSEWFLGDLLLRSHLIPFLAFHQNQPHSLNKEYILILLLRIMLIHLPITHDLDEDIDPVHEVKTVLSHMIVFFLLSLPFFFFLYWSYFESI